MRRVLVSQKRVLVWQDVWLEVEKGRWWLEMGAGESKTRGWGSKRVLGAQKGVVEGLDGSW